MRKAEEILAEAFEAHGLPELAAMYRAGHYHEDHDCAISAVQQAQREAIEEALKAASAATGCETQASQRRVRTAIRALLPHKE